MITIIKDNNRLRCSQNTYDTMYKRLGYEILIEKKEEPKEEIVKETIEEIIVPKETIEIKPTKTRTRTRSRTKKGE